MVLTFKILNGLAPAYPRDTLQMYQPSCRLRSVSRQMLSIPHTRLKTFGDRAFSVHAPKQWNCLPLKLRIASSLTTFKKELKTFLFTQCYSL